MEEESAIKILYDNKDTKCKNPDCDHLIDLHLHFKNIKDDRIPLIYCSEYRAKGQECKITRF